MGDLQFCAVAVSGMSITATMPFSRRSGFSFPYMFGSYS